MSHTTTHTTHIAQQANPTLAGYVTPPRPRLGHIKCPGAPRGRRLGFSSGSPVGTAASPLALPLATTDTQQEQ